MSLNPSDLSPGLASLSSTIRGARSQCNTGRAAIVSAAEELASIPAVFSELISSIEALDGADDFERTLKTALAQYLAEIDDIETTAQAAKVFLTAQSYD